MKKLLTPFALLTLTVWAAKPVNPILNVTCNNGDDPSFGCAGYEITAGPVDPAVSYQIDGSGPSGLISWGPFQGSAMIDVPTDGVLDAGSWTFEIHELGHNGNEKNKASGSFSTTF